MREDEIIARVADALPPYAQGLGLSVERVEGRMPVIAMPFGQRVEGRPGYLHGGSSSGLLEIAGFTALQTHLALQDRAAKLKPVNVTVQFLRGARSETTYAVGRVTRAGGRTANVDIEAWQSDRTKPVATAVMNFILSDA